MNTRRSFIKTIGTGATLSTIACTAPTIVSAMYVNEENKLKHIRIGIIGAENSHTVGFGKMFNIDKKFPGVEVTHLWGETDGFAPKAADVGKIPTIVKDQKGMLGQIDALSVDHRHAKYHLESATPFIKSRHSYFHRQTFLLPGSRRKRFSGHGPRCRNSRYIV